jgi:predicted nuclease with RNAse H fold
MEADQRRRGEVDALFAWIERHAPAVVAVDAPQAYRRPGPRPTAAQQRACDRALMARRISLYPVPTRAAVEGGAARLPDWMKAGFDHFRRLRRAGFEVPGDAVMPGALGAPPAALEVYPYGAFATLLGALPPSKATRAGLRLRIVTLRRAGLEWDEYYDHDSLDALVAALTALRFRQGLATPVGEAREGLIWLPVPRAELRDSYAPL